MGADWLRALHPFFSVWCIFMLEKQKLGKFKPCLPAQWAAHSDSVVQLKTANIQFAVATYW